MCDNGGALLTELDSFRCLDRLFKESKVVVAEVDISVKWGVMREIGVAQYLSLVDIEWCESESTLLGRRICLRINYS